MWHSKNDGKNLPKMTQKHTCDLAIEALETKLKNDLTLGESANSAGTSTETFVEKRDRFRIMSTKSLLNMHRHRELCGASGDSNLKSEKVLYWQSVKCLKSHLDSVRSIAFHPEDLIIVSAGEDNLVKLWNFQKSAKTNKPCATIKDPLGSFRAHTAPINSLAIMSEGKVCCSGDISGNIECWILPSKDTGLYDSYDPSENLQSLQSHTDAVLDLIAQDDLLFSLSADCGILLWRPFKKDPLLKSFTTNLRSSVPTSIALEHNKTNRLIISYNDSQCFMYDLENGQSILEMKTKKQWMLNPRKGITKVICHPISPITITGHQDGSVNYWDNKTGQLIHSFEAHLNEITSLAMDLDGLNLASSSHDCLLKVWGWDNRKCLQELNDHCSKNNEGIFDVAFHQTKPYMASAGADNTVRIYN